MDHLLVFGIFVGDLFVAFLLGTFWFLVFGIFGIFGIFGCFLIWIFFGDFGGAFWLGFLLGKVFKSVFLVVFPQSRLVSLL